MISLIIMLCVTAYGVWYAADPRRFLRRKFSGREIPASAVRTARIFGIVVVIAGAALSVHFFLRLTAGG